MNSEHGRSSPLPGGEREGPAPPFAAWEGEGGVGVEATVATWTPPPPAAAAPRVASPLKGEEGVRHRTTTRATARARELRTAGTDAERKLWSMVRGSQIEGCKFRRQTPIGRYIADFVCPARKLIVEVDGGQHTPEVDAVRTAFLEGQSYRVIRFWNREVLTNPNGVWRVIAAALAPLPGGEREGPAFALPRTWEGEGDVGVEAAVATWTPPPPGPPQAASLASPLQGEG